MEMIELPPVTMLLKLLNLENGSKTSKPPTYNLPPGPMKLPFIGNLHLLAGSDPPHRKLRDLAKKHGSPMHLQLGEINTIVVSSPEGAKQVFKTHDTVFAFRPSLIATSTMWYGNKDIAFAPYGDYWRQLRKICTSELLSKKRVQSFWPVREEEFLDVCKWIASNEGSLIDLTEKVCVATYDVITRSSLGKKTDKQAMIISIVKEVIEVGAGFHIADLYPSIKWFRMIGGFEARIQRLHRQSDKILEKIIDEHKLANASNVAGSQSHEDLIDVLLKLQDSDLDVPLAMDNIKAVLLDMFAAGSDTSSTTIDWAMVELLRNPRVLKKAQDEVRQLFDSKDKYVDESFFDELKYLKLVIKETLRLHPAVPLALPRESSEQCEIDGYKIPVKARVLVNVWAISRDPKHWENAESFIPERFLDSSIDYKGQDFEFTPFGAGRRICPGMSAGLANVELPLAMFLYHFDWSLPDGMKPEEMDMTENFGGTCARKNHLNVIPVLKRPLAV